LRQISDSQPADSQPPLAFFAPRRFRQPAERHRYEAALFSLLRLALRPRQLMAFPPDTFRHYFASFRFHSHIDYCFQPAAISPAASAG